MIIRRATEQDIPQLLNLMKGLARFEKYIDSFRVEERDLLEQGFRKDPPDFHALVAQQDDESLQGMLVYYFVPFTSQGKPTLYIKELYVDEGGRSGGVGTALMKAAAEIAINHGCGAMRWLVASWNKDGIRFYERMGAKANLQWADFMMEEDAMKKLIQ